MGPNVMAHLSEQTFGELFASSDARKLGERPKPKEAGEGKKAASLGSDGVKEEREDKRDWEEEDDEASQIAPEPVTP